MAKIKYEIGHTLNGYVWNGKGWDAPAPPPPPPIPEPEEEEPVAAAPKRTRERRKLPAKSSPVKVVSLKLTQETIAWLDQIIVDEGLGNRSSAVEWLRKQAKP